MGWISNLFKHLEPNFKKIRKEEHDILLNKDIEQFKYRFRNSLDMCYCPHKYYMYKILGYINIDKCDVYDLLKLGFFSENIWREDLDAKRIRQK